MSRITLQL